MQLELIKAHQARRVSAAKLLAKDLRQRERAKKNQNKCLAEQSELSLELGFETCKREPYIGVAENI